MAPMHNVELSPAIVERVKRRRGDRLHAYERLDPARTALIVIDMQNAWVEPGVSPLEIPTTRDIVDNINRLAAAVRAASFQRLVHDESGAARLEIALHRPSIGDPQGDCRS